jgi:hypothetical protein
MIPEFEPVTGNLPPGIHRATWDEIIARFGGTLERRELLDGFWLVVQALQEAGCKHIYLDGSFVTDVERIEHRPPRDFDGCWDQTGVDAPRLLNLAPALLLDSRWPRAQQKALYKGEMSIADLPADPVTGEAFLDFFQRDRQGRPKGIVLLVQGGAPWWRTTLSTEQLRRLFGALKRRLRI